MHFKETLAFFLQTAPAPVSSMLTSCSNRDQEWNALTGAAEYALCGFSASFLNIKIFSTPKIEEFFPELQNFKIHFHSKLVIRKKQLSFSVNGTSVNFKPPTQNSSHLTQNLSKLDHI